MLTKVERYDQKKRAELNFYIQFYSFYFKG